jgi:hypothetical protein
MKNKNFIINDDNSVRNCSRNLAKMNVIEYYKYINSLKDFYVNQFEGIAESFIQFVVGFKYLLSVLLLTIGLIFMPIVSALIIKSKINKAKKVIKETNK